MSVPTLFHGTDARILRMSQNEVKAFKKSIQKSLDYLWQFYKPYSLDNYHNEYSDKGKRYIMVREIEKLKTILNDDLYHSVYGAVSLNELRLNGRKQWQYDGLYLTNWDWQAWGYAKRASSFGELGLVAQILITGARKIQFNGWEPDSDTERAMNRIVAFSEGKPEPVVVILDNLDLKHIKDEGGEDLKEGSMSRVFMYDSEINLSDYPIIDKAPSGESMTDMLVYKNEELSFQTW